METYHHFFSSFVCVLLMALWFTTSFKVQTTCRLIQPPRHVFSNKISQRYKNNGVYFIASQWMNRRNFSTPSEALGNIEETLYDLTYNSDPITKEMVPWMEKVLESALNGADMPEFTPYQKSIQEIFHKEYKDYRKKWPQLIESSFSEQRQAEHHSLRFADQRIKDYIMKRDIVDVGSYIGDSMLIFAPYTEKNIYCYEVNEKSFKELKQNAALVGDKVKTIFNGLGSSEYQIGVSQKGGSTDTVKEGGDNLINITTLDKESVARNMKVGLIKADIEGMGYDLILGAKETIARDRPVLTILVYHNYDEFYTIPQVLREIGGYIIQYRGSQSYKPNLAEGQVFAIPQEVYFPKY